MEKGPSWEDNSHLAGQGILCLLGNLKNHSHVHKDLPLVPILNQMNPVHILWPISIRSILILSSHLCLGLPSWLFLSVFATKHVSSLSCLPCALTTSSSWFDHPNKIWWSVQVMKLLPTVHKMKYSNLH